MEDLTLEAFARWHQQLDRWIGQRAPQTERTRRRPWVMQPKTAHPAYRRETIMISIILIVAMVAGAGWFVWSRWAYWRTPIRPQPSAERSPQTRAFEAFTHGNSCLAAGQWADATAAFEQARTLDPKRPYVAERLAEVARRHHAASVAAGG
jgi:hypothetical protein